MNRSITPLSFFLIKFPKKRFYRHSVGKSLYSISNVGNDSNYGMRLFSLFSCTYLVDALGIGPF